jgi:transcriptional regulator with XRE-family HTH domain
MNLATKLVSLRKQKGLTQMKVAEMMNVSRQAISRWEVGSAVPSTDNLKVLGELYGVPVDYLLDDDAVCESKAAETTEEAEIPDDSTVVQLDECKAHKSKLIAVCIACVLVIVIAICALICVHKLQNRNTDAITPIMDMEIDHVDDVPDGTFTFE